MSVVQESSVFYPSVLHEVAVASMNFNAPVLLDPKHWKDAEDLTAAGLLCRHDAMLGSFSYSLTEAGIAAYHETAAPVPCPEPVKAWGECAPTTLEEQIDFIQKQYPSPLNPALFLEIHSEHGDECLILSEDALLEKKRSLGFDEYGNYQGEGVEPDLNSGYEEGGLKLLCWCDITGELLENDGPSYIEDAAYSLEGFIWRREQRFQMEEADWREAAKFIEMLEYLKNGNNQETKESAQKLMELIAASCFLEPECVNDTGLFCPGGCSHIKIEELIKMFQDVIHPPPFKC